ncbi:FAD binding domain-containing protein [Pisolithus thermaeus]|nr:FAD binding domain-containing protein [Pisolithus thermaeus]
MLPQTPESFVDVLIVGAGPAGLMCGNALAAAGGIEGRIIDQRPSKISVGHADGLHPRTIEVLQSYGLAERLLREGSRMYICAFYNPTPAGGIEFTTRVPDVTIPNARFTFKIGLHQGAIEDAFLDSMAQHNLKVDRPVKPLAIELSQDEEQLRSLSSYPIKVTLARLDAATDADELEVIHAKYVVGADGPHSWVRKAFGITMDGDQTNYVWGVVDMVPDTDFPDIRHRAAIHSTNGSLMIIPRENDKVRLYVQLQEKTSVRKSQSSPEKILEVARKTLHPFHISPLSDIEWWTIYMIGQRVASKFSVEERVFIAGDACHTHSPKAGQGMNASMSDTHNLAWKLAQVLREWANPSILRTYELERRKYAQDLIDFDKQYAALFSGKPRTSADQDGISHEQFFKCGATQTDDVPRTFYRAYKTAGGFTSGMGIYYDPSMIVNAKHQSCAENLVVGQRMLPQVFVRAADARPVEIHDLLPADTRFKILIFLGSTAEESRLAEVNALADELSSPTGFLRKYSVESQTPLPMFDLTTVVVGNKENFNYLNIPLVFRPHWSKVLLDDTDVTESEGGGGYERFGISSESTTFVIVRPDGHIGMVAPAAALQDVHEYFASFLIPHHCITRH